VCVLITFYICCLISDSPFRPLVVDPSKVIVSGGWQPLLDEHGKIPLVVNKEKQIPFDAFFLGFASENSWYIGDNKSAITLIPSQ
jgi:hypothetical protein